MTHYLASQSLVLPLKRLPWSAVKPVALLVAMLGIATVSCADPLPLAETPAGNGARDPAPNILLSIDNSGSMGQTVGTSSTTGIGALKQSLLAVFDRPEIEGTFRLGFQSMALCKDLSANPSSNYSPANYNCPDTRIKKFDSVRRSEFKNFVNKLQANGGTPSHSMMLNVHNYFQVTGVNGPFAKDPGLTYQPILSCRRTYHVFMTDGGWKDTGISAEFGLPGNADGTITALPENNHNVTEYNPAAAYARVYADSYAPVINDLKGGDRALRGQVSTLSDWAFMMWATDYRPGGGTSVNNIRPIIRQPDDTVFSAAGRTATLSEFWNPRNNPMSWQGITTFSIGFNNAANISDTRRVWKQFTGSNDTLQKVTLPKWGGDDGWSGDIVSMIVGEPGLSSDAPLRWPNPLRGWPLTAAGEFDDSLSGATHDYPYQHNYIAGLLDPQPKQSPNQAERDRPVLSPNSDKIMDLWHAGINGRGGFYPAKDQAALTRAFDEILNQIINDSIAPTVSIAANTQTITAGSTVFTAGYDAAKSWSGYIKAWSLDSSFNLDTPLWDAAVKLDARNLTASPRLVFTDLSVDKLFLWDKLTDAQQSAIAGGDAEEVAKSRLLYLRGDRSKEVPAQGGLFRKRESRLGDIVNSNVWVVGKPDLGYTDNNYLTFRATNSTRPTMLYVGANDGMLHGFDTYDGTERFAYVPRGVYPKLKALSGVNYSHRYFVDGHPFTGDFYDGSAWKTVLVGTLAGGGKGYFLLNVTSPGSLGAASGNSLVILDKTDGADDDIGHIFAEPTIDTNNNARAVQITKLNNGRWAVLMGNGVNSTSEKAVLLIQYLDGDKSLKKIVLDSTSGNGLANPQLIDINGDGKADVAYAGDRLGNLWKIDLSSTAATNWKKYKDGSGQTPPLFVARYGNDQSGVRQPITTAPQWVAHPKGGVMLAFGTGQDFTIADRVSTSVQTLYAVWDDAIFTIRAASPTLSMMSDGESIPGRSKLVEQTQNPTAVVRDGKKFFKTSSNTVNYSGANPRRGWYFDWPVSRERTVSNGGMLSDQLLYARSRVPAYGSQDDPNIESCERDFSRVQEFLTILNIVTGKPPGRQMFDGLIDSGLSRWDMGSAVRLLGKTSALGKSIAIKGCPPGDSSCEDQCPTGNPDCSSAQQLNVPQNLLEFGWRQLQ